MTFIPPYPVPHRNKASLAMRFLFGWKSWIHTLFERSYTMKMGEIHMPRLDFYIANELSIVDEVLNDRARIYPKHEFLQELLDPLIGNSVFSATNPAFLFLGSVTYTGGTWLDAVRIATTGAASGQIVTGEIGFSGLPSGRVGVDQVYLSASAVPEPGEWAAMGMLASGLGGLVIRARRRKLA